MLKKGKQSLSITVKMSLILYTYKVVSGSPRDPKTIIQEYWPWGPYGFP